MNLICPKCSKEMNFFQFAKAYSPWHMKCKYCKTKLKLEKHRLSMSVLAVTLGVVFGIIAVFSAKSNEFIFLNLIIAFIVIEIILFWVVKKLSIKLVVQNELAEGEVEYKNIYDFKSGQNVRMPITKNTCPKCTGLGYTTNYEDTPVKSRLTTFPCEYCNGTGKIN